MIKIENALVIAAHPDDEVLGVGGTIRLLKEAGAKVTVLIVTDGSTTQYPGDTDILEQKRWETSNANKILKTDRIEYLNYPDMRLDTVEHIDLNRSIEKFIFENKFDTVFSHHHGDVNLDHQIVFRSVLVATRPTPDQPVNNIFTYQVNSSSEWGSRLFERKFLPNIYFDISRTVEYKLKALETYKSELRSYPHPRSLEAVEARDKVTGSEIGCKYAEAFQLLLSKVHPSY